ncbi:MAG: cyclic nucleotide-binding domain-containing protein [Desulfobulbaceae bacterium]|nr:cyclic nucleotide-binding domain-containing protein [Desulfobulbaceae bacterium]
MTSKDDYQITSDEFCSAFPIFTESESQKIFSSCDSRLYPGKTTIWRQGDAGGYMGFLVRGKIVVKKETEFPGKHILLGILENGALFGEHSIVTSLNRSVTLVAKETSHALILTHDNAHGIMNEDPALGMKLLMYISEITGLRLQQSGSRLAEIL